MTARTSALFPKLSMLCWLLTVAATAVAQKVDVEAQLERLDSCIQMKAQLDRQKEDRLVRLKAELRTVKDANSLYRLNYQLFEEYKSYNFDSAFHYTMKAADQAVALKDRNCLVEAGCAVVFCYLSAGLYKEAFDAMKKVTHEGADEEHQKQYYMMWSRLYYDMANYNNSPPYEQHYVEQGNLYTDTLLRYVPENTVYWYYAQAQRQMKSHDFGGSVTSFQKLVDSHEADAHLLAIAYSCIGWSQWIEGREDEAICNLVESAICDIQSSIKENTGRELRPELARGCQLLRCAPPQNRGGRDPAHH